MKVFLAAFLFLTVGNSFFSRRPQIFGLTFKAKISSIKGNRLKIETILTNTSEDTVKYVTELCPSHEVFEIDRSSVQIIREYTCLKSGAEIVSLLPHESKIDTLSAIVLPSFDPLNPQFKIGFNFVVALNGDRPANFRDINNRIKNTRNFLVKSIVYY